jgi:hypothetical protein
MTNALPHIQVFIGSSTEGLKIARTLQAELEAATDCAVKRWDTDTFAPGSITLDALIARANSVDFAILVATGEDTVTSRGTQTAAVRDNIILEFGLFLGALGRKRVYLLSVGDAKLPSDLLGLTRLIYRDRRDGDIRAGLTDAVLRIEEAMAKLGPRTSRTQSESAQDISDVEEAAKEALSKVPGDAPAQRERLPAMHQPPVCWQQVMQSRHSRPWKKRSHGYAAMQPVKDGSWSRTTRRCFA